MKRIVKTETIFKCSKHSASIHIIRLNRSRYSAANAGNFVVRFLLPKAKQKSFVAIIG